jgi:hypothetical protein
VTKEDIWPPEEKPPKLNWEYEPYPASEENMPLVGRNIVMNIWQDVHHADIASHLEWQCKAPCHKKFLEWLKHEPHLLCQWLRGLLIDDEELDDAVAEDNQLPQNIHRMDEEQPEGQLRSRHVYDAIPKKVGDKIQANYRDRKCPEAWGLLFKEKFRLHRLLFFILLVYALTSLIIVIWLFRHYGLTEPASIGSVLWLVGWFASLFSLTVTVWFKWAENC